MEHDEQGREMEVCRRVASRGRDRDSHAGLRRSETSRTKSDRWDQGRWERRSANKDMQTGNNQRNLFKEISNQL